MDNPQDNNLGGLYLVDDQPTHADCLPVDLRFCRNLPTLLEYQGFFLNAIYGLKDLIPDPDGS